MMYLASCRHMLKELNLFFKNCEKENARDDEIDSNLKQTTVDAAECNHG